MYGSAFVIKKLYFSLSFKPMKSTYLFLPWHKNRLAFYHILHISDENESRLLLRCTCGKDDHRQGFNDPVILSRFGHYVLLRCDTWYDVATALLQRKTT